MVQDDVTLFTDAFVIKRPKSSAVTRCITNLQQCVPPMEQTVGGLYSPYSTRYVVYVYVEATTRLWVKRQNIPFHLTIVINYDSDCERCCCWLWQLTRYEHNGKVFVPVSPCLRIFKYRSGQWVTRRMQVTRRTNKSSDLLAWWTLGTRHDTNDHASLRPASAPVFSRFRAGFGPASIMDFGL